MPKIFPILYLVSVIIFTHEKPPFVEFLFAFCLSPILLVLLVTYVKSLGESKQVRHIVVMAVESEEESLVRY
jgi:cellulose synthase/poly-beta-1,6-N-acetylglucosamine synthase-like glycosyltransferase